jgi:hypothetical protein
VYSTGRSLESFALLIQEKAAVMATPDALICAVGTKVYRRRTTTADEMVVSDVGAWEEDPEWTAQLDKAGSCDTCMQLT